MKKFLVSYDTIHGDSYTHHEVTTDESTLEMLTSSKGIVNFRILKEFEGTVFNVYTFKDGWHDGAVEVVGEEALAKAIVADEYDKVVTDILDNIVVSTFGSFINEIGSSYKNWYHRTFASILIEAQGGEL
jgi:hypothetical protein